MITLFDLQKLVDHNFVSRTTAESLVEATGPGQNHWMKLKWPLESLISSIEKFELEHPLGMNQNIQLDTHNGYWNYNTKKFKFHNEYKMDFTLEDFKELYKIVVLLSLLDTV